MSKVASFTSCLLFLVYFFLSLSLFSVLFFSG